VSCPSHTSNNQDKCTLLHFPKILAVHRSAVLVQYFRPNFSTSFYSELNMIRNIKLVCEIIHPNYFFCWRIIMANHRRPYSWKVICTHLTFVVCPSLTKYMWLREPQRPAVFHILCQTYFVCKFLHDSVCTVSRGVWVGRPPKFIFTLVPLMSPDLLYAT
jgi:hypothetical protein